MQEAARKESSQEMTTQTDAEARSLEQARVCEAEREAHAVVIGDAIGTIVLFALIAFGIFKALARLP